MLAVTSSSSGPRQADRPPEGRTDAPLVLEADLQPFLGALMRDLNNYPRLHRLNAKLGPWLGMPCDVQLELYVKLGVGGPAIVRAHVTHGPTPLCSPTWTPAIGQATLQLFAALDAELDAMQRRYQATGERGTGDGRILVTVQAGVPSLDWQVREP